MAKIDVNGLGIAYEIIGDGKRTAVITTGGRFSKDTPGVRELAQKLAEGGLRTLVWDRPNCGESDFSFSGETESRMNADALAGLLRALKFAPAVVVGGSAGSRVSLITAIQHPDVVERLFIFWITGGTLSLIGLGHGYCHDSWMAAAMGGMEAVAALPMWKEQLERNPGNRDRLLRQSPVEFMKKMNTWAAAFAPEKNSPVPGLLPADLASLKMPVMVLRSGQSDFSHPRETSEAVHGMIPGAKIADPPWGDREWIDRVNAMMSPGEGLFARWPLLAPQILKFAAG